MPHPEGTHLSHTCAACGVATCFHQNGVRTMQPGNFERERYTVIEFVAGEECVGQPLELESTFIAKLEHQLQELLDQANYPAIIQLLYALEITDLADYYAQYYQEQNRLDLPSDFATKILELLEANRQMQFVILLTRIGLPRLAEHFEQQIRAGVARSEIILPTEQPYQYPQSPEQPAPEALQQAQYSDISPEEADKRGEESEARLIAILQNREVFPWISDVIVAPKNNPKYDCTIIVDQRHPIGKLLKTPQVYLDAKSSHNSVDTYYARKTYSQKAGARLKLVREKNLWAINAYAERSNQEVYAQIVTYILMATGKFNQSLHWDQVLQHLHEDVRVAFRAEIAVVLDFGRIVMQTLLDPRLEQQLKKEVRAEKAAVNEPAYELAQVR